MTLACVLKLLSTAILMLKTLGKLSIYENGCFEPFILTHSLFLRIYKYANNCTTL